MAATVTITYVCGKAEWPAGYRALEAIEHALPGVATVYEDADEMAVEVEVQAPAGLAMRARQAMAAAGLFCHVNPYDGGAE
jgi:hypothetical protein